MGTNLLKRSRRWVDEGHDRNLGIGGTESLVPDLEIEGTDGTGGGALPDPTRHLPEIAEKTSGANKLNWETNSEDWLMSVLMDQRVALVAEANQAVAKFSGLGASLNRAGRGRRTPGCRTGAGNGKRSANEVLWRSGENHPYIRQTKKVTLTTGNGAKRRRNGDIPTTVTANPSKNQKRKRRAETRMKVRLTRKNKKSQRNPKSPKRRSPKRKRSENLPQNPVLNLTRRKSGSKRLAKGLAESLRGKFLKYQKGLRTASRRARTMRMRMMRLWVRSCPKR